LFSFLVTGNSGQDYTTWRIVCSEQKNKTFGIARSLNGFIYVACFTAFNLTELRVTWTKN